MIIDGKAIAARRLEDLRFKIEDLRYMPKLVAVMVGEDPSSKLYVELKSKKAREVGIDSEVVQLPQDISAEDLIAKIKALNADTTVSGILVQLPFPKGSPAETSWYEILNTIDPKKDVDCLGAENMGLLAFGKPRFYPATVKGVLIALEEGLGVRGKGLEVTQDKNFLRGMRVCVVGRSDIVGKPLAIALIALGATVTVCNSQTENLGEVTKQADILIPATGKAELIKAEMVKEGAIVIDVGINQRIADSGQRIVVGDIDFEAVKNIASAISPVPGGVGPLTVVSLLENTYNAAKGGDFNG